jgi:hypothetical protein
MRLLARGMSWSIACAWPAVVGICIELTRTPSSAVFNRPFVVLLHEVGVSAVHEASVRCWQAKHLWLRRRRRWIVGSGDIDEWTGR